MSKITLQDTLVDVVYKLSECHPNALTVLLEYIKKNSEIDPVGDAIMNLLWFDTFEIYGERIWKLYERCGWDILKFSASVRGCQLGCISREQLNELIDGFNEVNLDEIVKSVQERLPEFGINYTAKSQTNNEAEDCSIEVKDGYVIVSSTKYTGEQIAKRYFYLAYEASNVGGFGILQARGGVDEDAVYANVAGSGDYPGCGFNNKKDEPYGDYVFGRMMKVGCKVLPNGIQVRDGAGRLDYQSWASKYPTYKDLAIAAVNSLNSK